MNASTTLNLGFIGLGQAVNRMFVEYAAIGELPYRIAAAAETRPDALDRFRAEFGGLTFDRAEDLCACPGVDVVYIATPPQMHLAHAEMAASNGKHIIVEKPMALTIEDCERMVAVAERNGVKLLAGHTHSFDAPIRKMQEIVSSGEIGDLVMVNAWNFNEFNVRPWPTAELIDTDGPILNQGPHHVDIARQIAGGLVKSVRATTFPDALRGCAGGYLCFLEFEGGASASLVYDARGYFDSAELFWWGGESGAPRDPETNFKLKRNLLDLAALGADEMEARLEAQKEQGRYGATVIDPDLAKLRSFHGPEAVTHHPFFGLVLVTCERGAIRQTLDGVRIYRDTGAAEVVIGHEHGGRYAELMDLHGGIVDGRPVFHDGRWGMATLEVCLAIPESARTGKEIGMTRQVPVVG